LEQFLVFLSSFYLRVCNCQNLCLCSYWDSWQIRVATNNIIERAVQSVNTPFSADFTVQEFGDETS